MNLKVLLAGLLVAGCASLAAAESAVRGERLAASCANCHGTNGHAVDATFPSLAGRSRDDLVDAMRAYKSGARPATVMHQLAKGYADADIERIAAFLSAQPASAK